MIKLSRFDKIRFALTISLCLLYLYMFQNKKMKTLFTKSLFITFLMILMNFTLLAETDSITCTFFLYPKASVGCHTYISYQGNAGTSATFTWNFNGGAILSGSGPGPYYVKWDTAGYKTVSLSVLYNGQTCSSSHVIHIVSSPVVYSVTGGGSYPSGGSGVHIGLSSSQLSYGYYLFKVGSSQSVANKTGTGGAIDFGIFTTPGIYKCQAKVDSASSSCLVMMNDSAIVTISGYVPSQAICIVSYDTTYQRNKVKWYKTAGQHLNHYNIYRQTYQYNVFKKIADVPYLSPNTYIDTTADPAMMSYKYEISATDSLGSESPMSPYHKSIHLEVSPGVTGFNLIWNAYEGCSYLTCKIHRKFASEPWQVIDSVASDITSYTDQYITSGLAYYFIEVVRYYQCLSFKSTDDDAVSSNIGISAPVGLNENSGESFLVYPNPVVNNVNIILRGQGNNDTKAQFYTVEGKKILENNLINTRNEVDISAFPSGIYILKITDNHSTLVRKLFKQ